MMEYKKKHPVATQEDIHDADFDLDFTFPDDFRDFALSENGGTLPLSMSREPGISILYGLGRCEESVVGNTMRLREVWSMPSDLIAVASDGCGYSFCFRMGRTGVWHWDRETGEMVAPSFSDFLTALRDSDEG